MDEIEIVPRASRGVYEGFTLCEGGPDEIVIFGPGAAVDCERSLRVPYAVLSRAAERAHVTLPRMWPALVVHAPAVVAAFTASHAPALGAASVLASLSRCLVELVRVLPSSAEHVSLRLARAYLQAHYSDKVELTDLARAARIGKYQLVHLFSAQLGFSPFRYLAELRLLEVSPPCRRRPFGRRAHCPGRALACL